MTLIFDATNAYLGPLLAKHTAGQPLVWEDLVASQAACSAVLSQCSNPFVSVSWTKIRKFMHTSNNYYWVYQRRLPKRGKGEGKEPKRNAVICWRDWTNQFVAIDAKEEQMSFFAVYIHDLESGNHCFWIDSDCAVLPYRVKQNKRRVIPNVPYRWNLIQFLSVATRWKIYYRSHLNSKLVFRRACECIEVSWTRLCRLAITCLNG